MIYVHTKQSVFPKTIYIGDIAELRCTFTGDANLTTGPLTTEAFTEAPDFSVYEIKEISVQHVQQTQQGQNTTYDLVISFVPWHTGKIQIPDYEILGVGTIHFEAVEVLSLVEQQKVTELRNYSSPLLLPGTTYKIYISICVFVVLLILLVRLIVKWHSVVFWFNNARLKRRYFRNKRNTIRALKKLGVLGAEEGHSKDSEICTKLQKLIRGYLELRLNYPFTKKLTSEMSMTFEEACCGLADEQRYDAFEKIISAFVRTDFIRFSDSSAARFKQGELENLINELIAAIEIIEGGKDA